MGEQADGNKESEEEGAECQTTREDSVHQMLRALTTLASHGQMRGAIHR